MYSGSEAVSKETDPSVLVGPPLAKRCGYGLARFHSRISIFDLMTASSGSISLVLCRSLAHE